MSRALGAATRRLRFALALMAGGVVTLLIPSLLASGVDAPAVVVAGLVAALAAVVGLSSEVATLATLALAPPPRTAGSAPVFLGGRVTDPVHHPIRPRAPDMA